MLGSRLAKGVLVLLDVPSVSLRISVLNNLSILIKQLQEVYRVKLQS